ncbi:hypothetical protein OAF45_03310 [Candidatus Latescibacteria bacterium]|nr:hypothetical protein [Candidatus Latescibacterota bacterium]
MEEKNASGKRESASALTYVTDMYIGTQKHKEKDRAKKHDNTRLALSA